MRPKTIGVLLHKNDTYLTSMDYLVRPLLKEWEGMGFRVEVIRGIERFVPADVMIPHVDLTVTPNEYREFLNQYPVVVNRRVVDISKSMISRNLLAKDDAYVGPVIVKTNRNAGGFPEQRLFLKPLRRPSLPARAMRKVLRVLRRSRTIRISWRDPEVPLPFHGYPVFSSLADVPKKVFENRSLIVERFLPESEGDTYHVRKWFGFGDREINILVRSKDRLGRSRHAFDIAEVSAPLELREIRERLGFEYGKLDYVLRDGKVVLFDANRTPVASTLARAGLADKAVQHLAGGIWSVIGREG